LVNKTKFKETEIGLIPEDWEVGSLGSKINIIGGGTPSTSVPEYWNGGIPWISVVDFQGSKRWIHDTEKHITKKGLDESSTKLLHKDQLVISGRGTVGEIGQVTKDMAFNQSCYGLDGNDYFDNDFLYCLLKHRVNDLQKRGHGAVFNTITKETFNQIFVPLPSLSEQKLIAKILSDIDRKIELLQDQNNVIEKIGQFIFKHWFVDFEFPNEEGNPYKSSGGEMIESEMGEIPKGWTVQKIGHLLETVLGGTPSTRNKSYWENGSIPWINSGKVNEFRILEPSELITKEAIENSATKLMPKRTTLIAITGATLGQISLTEIETCANQSVVGILGNDKLPSEFVYLWIKHRIAKIVSGQTGGAQQHINKNNVNETLILEPQKYVLDSFVQIVKPLFDKISTNCFESNSLTKTRDVLLPKLMSGKIRVLEVN